MAVINTRALISIIIPIVVIFTGCTANQTGRTQLQSQIDGLQDQIQKIEKAYKPGFGELMGIIQTHHTKLWYAGMNENWKLAEFEIHEIEETFEKIAALHGDRDNAGQLIPALIYPVLENTGKAAENKDVLAFKESYNQLTTGCNNCHLDTGFEFIKIKTPAEPGFPDQQFSIKH